MRHFLTIGTVAVLILAGSVYLRAADVAAPGSAPGVDEATQKKIDSKTKRLIDAAKIDDAAKAEKVKAILGTWFVAMWDWHKTNDAELGKLWAEWSKARSVGPKDEFPGEVVAHKIDDFYGSLKPAYESMLAQLGAELTAEQIDAIKETWSRSPGMTRTYNADLEIVPDLTDEQKKVIHDRMLLAREAAMLTDADKEIVNIYKVHKVKVEAYVGTIEWANLSGSSRRGWSGPTPVAIVPAAKTSPTRRQKPNRPTLLAKVSPMLVSRLSPCTTLIQRAESLKESNAVLPKSTQVTPTRPGVGSVVARLASGPRTTSRP